MVKLKSSSWKGKKKCLNIATEFQLNLKVGSAEKFKVKGRKF